MSSAEGAASGIGNVFSPAAAAFSARRRTRPRDSALNNSSDVRVMVESIALRSKDHPCPPNDLAFSGERPPERSEEGRSSAATPCWAALPSASTLAASFAALLTLDRGWRRKLAHWVVRLTVLGAQRVRAPLAHRGEAIRAAVWDHDVRRTVGDA